MEKSLKFMKVSSVALMMAGAAAFTAVPVSWDAAYAKGGQGGGHGKGGGSGGARLIHQGGSGGGKPAHAGGPRTRTRTQQTTAVTTEDEILETEDEILEAARELEALEETVGNPRNYGAIASVNKWRNAAHASATARENAAPHSAVGRMATYRNAVIGSSALANDVTAAEDELVRLTSLTDAEIAAEFPDGGYEDAVLDASDALADANDALAEAPTAEDALDIIDGADLSDEALAELHRLLGIESTTSTVAGTTDTGSNTDTIIIITDSDDDD